MYLLTIKDGLGTRHIGPYPSPKHASDDLDRVLESCPIAPVGRSMPGPTGAHGSTRFHAVAAS